MLVLFAYFVVVWWLFFFGGGGGGIEKGGGCHDQLSDKLIERCRIKPSGHIGISV